MMSLFCGVNRCNVRSWQVSWVFVLCQTTCPVKFPHCAIICPCSNALHLRLIVLSPPTVLNRCLLLILCQLMFVWTHVFFILPVWLLTHLPLFQPKWTVLTFGPFLSLHSEFPPVLNFICDIKKNFLLLKKSSMINIRVVTAFLFFHVEIGHYWRDSWDRLFWFWTISEAWKTSWIYPVTSDSWPVLQNFSDTEWALCSL